MRIALVIAMLVGGCRRPPRSPIVWIGLDRTQVACAPTPGDFFRPDQTTCIGGGAKYDCVLESDTYQCARRGCTTPEQP